MGEIAVLMAAGMGTRMRPLTEKIPKPLVKVKGTPMIETVINALIERRVEYIYVITGYKGDAFQCLLRKYDNLSLIANSEYETVNNISSVMAACDVIDGKACFICEADLYIADSLVLKKDISGSAYFGKMVKGYSDDWLFTLNNSGRVIHIGKGGENCYNMCGISYFTEGDSHILAEAVREAYKGSDYKDLFWDEIVDRKLDDINMSVIPVSDKEIIEIDTVEELTLVDDSYKSIYRKGKDKV